MNFILHFACGGGEGDEVFAFAVGKPTDEDEDDDECGELCVDDASCTVSAVEGVSHTIVTDDVSCTVSAVEGVSRTIVTVEGVSPRGRCGLGVPSDGVAGDGTACA